MTEFAGYILRKNIPQKDTIIAFAKEVQKYLFPIVYNEEAFHAEQERHKEQLEQQLLGIVGDVYHYCPCNAKVICDSFMGELPTIRQKLITDAKAILHSDPAAYSLEEVIIAYPGFAATLAYRIANPLFRLGLPIVPRIITEWAHSCTGIDINPGATIGVPFIIDHGTGVVIGETTIIGNNVRIYQGVTLGALVVEKNEVGQRHPVIEDNVVLYANCTILGGSTVIGHDAVIGGNCFITQSVPPYNTAYHRSEITIKKNRFK